MTSVMFGTMLILAPWGAGEADAAERRQAVARPGEGFDAERYYGVRNLYPLKQLQAAIRDGDGRGLRLDLSGVTRLLDGTAVEPAEVYGWVHVGPYPFEAAEAEYAYKRYRASAPIRRGRAVVPVGYLLRPKVNSEGWTDRGQVAVRIELRQARAGRDRDLGTYDTFVAFRKGEQGFQKQPSIVEGPFVCNLTSDDPTRGVIFFRTDQPVVGTVELDGEVAARDAEPTVRHELTLTGLEPGRRYRYRVTAGPTRFPERRFRAAPRPGEGPVRFCYAGDSREGHASTERGLMGVNQQVLERNLSIGFARQADFFLMGGDLVNGYTSVVEDFRVQLHAWKQGAAGFWHSRPVFPAMGNHETLLRVFKGPEGRTVRLDRWPYATQSAEAVFAEAFVNPTNGPRPTDPRRPAYAENVYSFRYGPVMVIAFNNNYWYSNAASRFGGSPEGYIFEDQLAWIGGELDRARRDPTVRYVVLFAQEPVFPNGGHVKDAMWYHGNNNVRAHSLAQDGSTLVPKRLGIIEVRNALARRIAACPKVACVLTSDEHSYHRVLIDRHVPVGDPARDDANGNGILGEEGETVSPLADLEHPTWYITSGGCGAPYYAVEPTPWNRYWRGPAAARADVDRPFFYSSQENILLFHATPDGLSLEVFTPYGQRLDRIADLMACKRER